MKESVKQTFEQLFEQYPALETCRADIRAAFELLAGSFRDGGKLMLCGNGGSCADCEHITGELMKGFLSRRPITPEKKAEMLRLNPTLSEEVLSKLQLAVPAIPLPSLTGLNSAFCNDVDPQLVYAQELMGLGKTGDMLLCISTSGNSANCVAAAEVGKALGLTVIALTGSKGGLLKEKADICICVPETETFKVQELHLPVYHYLCAKAEKVLFD